MIASKPGARVEAEEETKQKFYVSCENGFEVLPGKRVVGADGSNLKNLVIETIPSGKVQRIGTHSDLISTLLFDPYSETLLTGDGMGHVIQYQKKGDSFEPVRDFGYLGVGGLLSCVRAGDLAVFGGPYSSLAAISLSRRALCKGVVKVPCKSVFSLRLCEGTRKYLSVGGSSPDYSRPVSDCLDVGEICPSDLHPSKQFTQAALLESKDSQIKLKQLKISELEFLLSQEKSKTRGKTDSKISRENWRKTPSLKKVNFVLDWLGFKRSREFWIPSSSEPKASSRP